MKFILIPADLEKPIEVVQFEGKGYDKARELLGGAYIQLVQVQGYKRLHMCTDEEGKVFGKPLNFRASLVAGIGQDIVGDVVICGKNFKDVEAAAPEIAAIISSWEPTVK